MLYLNGRSVALAMALVGFAIMVGCSGSKTVTRPPEKSGEIENFQAMKEDFNPVDLNDDDIEIPESDGGEVGLEDILSTSSAVSQDTIGTGYRVQIIQTTDPEEARNVEGDAIMRFDEAVYRVFDPPFYKVRVGDFVNWNDAEKVQKVAIQRGFRDAWVIRTKISLKKAYKEVDAF